MAVPEFLSNRTTPVVRSIKLKQQRPDVAALIVNQFGLSPVVGRIVAARGFEPDERFRQFIEPTLKEGLPAPERLKNIDLACDEILACHKAGKPIAICCDFDVDGLSGGSLFHAFLRACEIPSQVYVPDRFVDGYGLNERTIREVTAAGFGLLVTIDFGTTNVKELEVAKSLGLRTVVVDHHHTAGKIPPADVFVNPHQDGCGFADRSLCAAGLAWYLCVALKKKLGITTVDPREYLDLACLGTICDMVPLIGANRVIAKRGLELLSGTRRIGLRSLKSISGIKRDKVGCSDVSFGIGPRLNAAGRLVSGELVVKLLTTFDTAEADRIASKLNQLNVERQEIEAVVKSRAIEIVQEQGGPGAGIVVWDETFHTGVIGIVAQRLVETFYRPSAVMGVDSPGVFKGSVRGIKGFSVVEALSSVGEHLMKFGGHDGAGGFSVRAEKIEEFRDAFIDECVRRLEGLETVPYSEADTEVEIAEISKRVIRELESLAPFGIGNAAPLVLARNVHVSELRILKGVHTKVVLRDGKGVISGVFWRQTDHPHLKQNARVNVVFRPEISTYQGNDELMANIQAVGAAS
jgi:single-stranded-DNA-specific exonuclease